MTKVHIAGMAVLLGQKGRKLCAWCGHVLFDVDLSCIAVAPKADGTPGDAPRPWTQGALVAVAVHVHVGRGDRRTALSGSGQS